jgi:predicted peptidase
MEEKIFDGMKYLIDYPDDFSPDKKYPLVVFLHGRGARRETTEKMYTSPSLGPVHQRRNERGYVFLAPHCKSGNWNEWMGHVIRLIDEIRHLPYVDITRVHLTGISMGGYGSWALATLRSDWFASAMPLCGGGLPGMANELKKLPIRAFHGLSDQIVDPIESLQMVQAVNLLGGNAELILLPLTPHNCAVPVYSDDKNWDWFLSFTNQREEAE